MARVKKEVEHIEVLSKYNDVIKHGRLAVFKGYLFNFGHASIPRGGKRLHIEYLIPKTRTYLACPKGVKTCKGRFAGYVYLKIRDNPILEGNSGPKILYKCKHGMGTEVLLRAMPAGHPIKRYS